MKLYESLEIRIALFAGMVFILAGVLLALLAPEAL